MGVTWLPASAREPCGHAPPPHCPGGCLHGLKRPTQGLGYTEQNVHSVGAGWKGVPQAAVCTEASSKAAWTVSCPAAPCGLGPHG